MDFGKLTLLDLKVRSRERPAGRILGSTKPLKLDSLRRLAGEVGFSPSVNSGMPYPIGIIASPVELETNWFQNAVRLVPINLLPTARMELEKCSRTP